MTSSLHPGPFLAPFFNGEWGYCRLLELLLTADTRLAGSFRQEFSLKVLQPTLDVKIGPAPVNVRSEVTVKPAGERSQTIDLVVDLESDVIGIETKVLPGSARKGQLAAQYRGLRQETPQGKRVHSLLIFPGPTGRHAEVKPLAEGDHAGSVSWQQDVFGCFPAAGSPDPDVLLGAFLEQSVAHFPTLIENAPITTVTAERQLIHAAMTEAISLFNRHLNEGFPVLRGCVWKPYFWRDPRNDVFYGPLTGPHGSPNKGQLLALTACYDARTSERMVSSTEAPLEVQVRVSFGLERQGGAKTYHSEFERALPDRTKLLPAPIGRRGPDRDGTELFDEFSVKIQGPLVSTSGRPAQIVFADLLMAYALAFSDFLLRDSRP